MKETNKGEWIYFEYKLYQVESVGLDTLQLSDGRSTISAKKTKCRKLTQQTKIASEWFMQWEQQLGAMRGIDPSTVKRILAERWLILCDTEDISERSNKYIEIGDYLRNKL